MKLTLYFSRASLFSSTVRFHLAEKGIASYTSKHIDLRKMENLTPEYLRINPRGKVPVLVIEEPNPETIPDSLAISRRLESGDIGGTSLAPGGNTDPGWAFVERVHKLNSFRITFAKLEEDPAAASLKGFAEARNSHLRALAKEHPDLRDAVAWKLENNATEGRVVVSEAEHQEAWVAFEALFDQAEEVLAGGRDFLGGNHYGVADAHVTPVLSRVTVVGRAAAIQRRPALSRYWQRMQQRPSFREVYGGQLV